MTVQQVKPEYTKIVAAIPHSVGSEHHWQWLHNKAARRWRDRYVDWFTDELFGLDIPGVSIVKANICRLECDVERLEGEGDRLCNFVQVADCQSKQERILGAAKVSNGCLAAWYRYRAEILEAAREGESVIVDCHSFPYDIAPDVDVCIGFNEDASKPSQRTIESVERIFRDAGYTVAFNRPFANSLAPIGYMGHSLMIEVNKRTYMDEKTLQKSEGFEKMKAAIGAAYHELLWMREHKPRNFDCPHDYFKEEWSCRDATWEEIKRSIVEFTAARYGVSVPMDLSDSKEVVALRRTMEMKWGSLSWEARAAWYRLAYAMMATVFGRVGVTLPRDAFVGRYMPRRNEPENKYDGVSESVRPPSGGRRTAPLTDKLYAWNMRYVIKETTPWNYKEHALKTSSLRSIR